MPLEESSDEEPVKEVSGNAAEFDFCEDQNILEEPDKDTMRVLLSTDNHLGYEENDDVRGMDSFAAFEEVLYLAKRFRCDMVLLAGDLFHENRPSRRTLYKTMEILRRYTMGQNPVQVQILGDPNAINYLNPNISVDLPLFSIHGNHDDPTRDGGDLLAALDLLHVNLLVNYFGRQSEVNQVQISPVLLQKGSSRVALYGLGSLREERLHRMWRDGKVSFLRPESSSANPNKDGGDQEDLEEHKDDEEENFFNIFTLHQNRDVGRGSKNCVQETMIPDWMDVVVWGHEHECQIDFTESVMGTFRITQPGSSVATSLVAGEAVIKQIGIMDIRGKNFRLHKVPLTQIRPFVTNEVVLSQHKATLDPEDNQVDSKVTKVLEEEVRLLIHNAHEKHEQVLKLASQAGSNVEDILSIQRGQQKNKNPVFRHSPVHPQKVLVRVRVEHSGFSTLNNQRFGAKFVDEIANSDNILLFHRKKGLSRDNGAGGTSAKQKKASRAIDKPMDAEELEDTHMEDLVRDFLELPNQKLKLLEEKVLSEAMEAFVEKQSTQAIHESTNSHLKKKQKLLIKQQHLSKGDDIKKAVEETQEKPKNTSTVNGSLDDSLDLDDDKEEATNGKKRKKATSKKARLDEEEDVDESLLDDDDDNDNVQVSAPKRKRAPAKSRSTSSGSSSNRRNMLDDDDDEEEMETPAPKKSRATARSTTSRRAATKKKVNYSLDNSDDDDDDDEVVEQVDDSDDEVLVVEEPVKKKSRARAPASTAGRKKKTAAASTSTRKKRTGRAASYMDSDNEDDFRGAGGSSAAVLDDDWGSAATRSQI